MLSARQTSQVVPEPIFSYYCFNSLKSVTSTLSNPLLLFFVSIFSVIYLLFLCLIATLSCISSHAFFSVSAMNSIFPCSPVLNNQCIGLQAQHYFIQDLLALCQNYFPILHSFIFFAQVNLDLPCLHPINVPDVENIPMSCSV